MSFFSNFIESITGKIRLMYISGGGTRSRPKDMRIENDSICAAILDANATHIARGQILHVIKDENGRIKKIKRSSEYTKLFERPNRMMTGREFKYAMAWQAQVAGSAFAWVKWQGAHPVEVWPLVYFAFEVKEMTGGYAVQFRDQDKEYVVPVEDLIVIRRKFDGSGFAGIDNGPLGKSIEMVDNLDDGLMQAMRVANRIHGIVKQKNAMLDLRAGKTEQLSFAERMEHASKNGGFVSMDAMEDYIPLNVSTWAANAAQAKQITDRIYTYWRTPESVVNNTSDEQTNMNYHDSIVEPMWECMAEAFTKALFTSREMDFGNAMIMASSATAGASWQTKLNIIKETKEVGLLTKNQYLELLGYPPTEDGDESWVSLNYIKASDQSKYQVGSDPDDGKKGGENDG